MSMKKILSGLLLAAILAAFFGGCDFLTSEPLETIPVTPITRPVAAITTDADEKATTQVETEADTQEEILTVDGLDPASLPAYTGSPFAVVNGNIPVFSKDELTTAAYESYSPLDALDRCGVAIASCGREIMPAEDEERGSISSVYPSGWVQAQYDCVSGRYLYNRAHLIGWQLSAENANERNLITGTRYMNVEGMLPFENMVADYIRETGNHVAYRITPIYVGNEWVCRGVQMEAYSIEDEGEGICFNVYCYNVQPGVVIDYATGESYADGTTPPSAETRTEAESDVVGTYILNTSSKKIHKTTCGLADDISASNRQEYTGDVEGLLSSGYTTCGNCFR